jgi:histidine triad (HIT) family protein
VSQCLFCQIVGGTIEASVAYRDDVVMGVMDLFPVSPGHLLVIPAEHHTSITDLPEETGLAMWSLAHPAARAVRENVDGVEGINLLISQGEVAQQHVLHSHLHVIPRRSDDGMVLTSPEVAATRADLDAMSDRLSRALRSPGKRPTMLNLSVGSHRGDVGAEPVPGSPRSASRWEVPGAATAHLPVEVANPVVFPTSNALRVPITIGLLDHAPLVASDQTTPVLGHRRLPVCDPCSETASARGGLSTP